MFIKNTEGRKITDKIVNQSLNNDRFSKYNLEVDKKRSMNNSSLLPISANSIGKGYLSRPLVKNQF